MAPQNSTLLHEENFELTSEMSRYSPILPLKAVGGGNDYNTEDADGGISSSTGYDVGAGIVHDKKSIYTGNATINIQQVRFEIPRTILTYNIKLYMNWYLYVSYMKVV